VNRIILVHALRCLLTIVIVIAAASAALAHDTSRSAALRAEFQRVSPCPASGNARVVCPGLPGASHLRANVQWQGRTGEPSMPHCGAAQAEDARRRDGVQRKAGVVVIRRATRRRAQRLRLPRKPQDRRVPLPPSVRVWLCLSVGGVPREL